MTAPYSFRKPWLARHRPVAGLALAGLFALLTSAAFPYASAGAGPSQEQKPAPPLAGTGPAIPPAARGTKLILKDGTFHLVRSYECRSNSSERVECPDSERADLAPPATAGPKKVERHEQKGARVRYYSVERSAWEEIPADLVDWEATRKAEKAEAQETQGLLEKARASETAARASEIDVDASIEYAPGHFLPETEGFYAVDGTTIVQLTSVGADVKLDKGRLLTQILVPIPIISSRHRVRLAGKKASVRLTTSQPEFYFRTTDEREPEIELLRAEIKGNTREIQVVDTNIVGDQSRRGKVMSVERWKVARGVYRFTMGEPLPPGEYAVAEYIPGEGMGFYLWDFGLDRSSVPSPAEGPCATRDKSNPAPTKQKP